MNDFGVFEVLAADEASEHLTSRKALLLAEGRIEAKLGKWLRTAASSEAYDALLAYSQDDFDGIVREACEEVGHSNPEAIRKSLRAHFRPSEPRTASVHEARKPKMCPYHSEVVDISLASGDPQSGYSAMSGHAWGPQHCQGEGYAGKCNFKRDMVTKSYWDDRQKALDEKREQRQELPQELFETEAPVMDTPVTEIPQDTIDQDIPEPVTETVEAPIEEAAPVSDFSLAMASRIAHVTPLVKEEGDTSSDGQPATPKGQTHSSSENPSDQNDEGKTVPCPQCGGDGESNSGKKCSKCQGKGKVSDWGPSTLDSLDSKAAFYPGTPGNSPEELDYLNSEHPIDYSGALQGLEREHEQGVHQRHADRDCPLCVHPGEGMVDTGEERYHPAYGKTADQGNTGLGGPEPKMDKAKWTPQNVKEIPDDSKYNPTKRKDPIDPIKAINDDELTEIGEKTTERVTLDTAGDDGSFSDGGQTKGESTKTWDKGKHEVDPVTSKVANQFIKERDGKWVVTKHSDGSVISTHDSKEKAEASFKAMMMHKGKEAAGGPSYPPEQSVQQTQRAMPYNPGAVENSLGLDEQHPAVKYAYERAIQQGANPQDALQTAREMQNQMGQQAVQGIQQPEKVPYMGKADDVNTNPIVDLMENDYEGFVPESRVKSAVDALSS